MTYYDKSNLMNEFNTKINIFKNNCLKIKYL